MKFFGSILRNYSVCSSFFAWEQSDKSGVIGDLFLAQFDGKHGKLASQQAAAAGI